MKQAQWIFLAIVCCVCTASGLAQKKICVGSIAGGDAPTWNIQQPLLKAIVTEANSRGVTVSTGLLMNGGEKQAKGEMQSNGCDFAIMTNVSREWPTPKGGSGINGGGGEPKEDDKPHPASTANFHFAFLDKSGKRVDKLDRAIEMQRNYTAKNVDTELQEMIQGIANLVVDDATAK